MAKRVFSPRKVGLVLDAVHVLLGISAVVMAVFAVMDPVKNRVLFPVIFLITALVNFVNAWFLIRMFPRIRKKQLYGYLYLFTGILILCLFAVSAVSLWKSS